MNRKVKTQFDLHKDRQTFSLWNSF